jgi:methylated-DNA-[protein]-cysteine S-methyltransferase
MEPSRKAPSLDDCAEDARAAPLAAATRQLNEYFAGTRREFDLPLRSQGTQFQQRVWRELAAIPYGQTWSYGDLAARIGKPSASRAVGLANGRNPISILVPCHRVIGANGSLTGYGGGLERKQWLLEHEGVSSRGFDLDQGQRDREHRAAPVQAIGGKRGAAVKLGNQPHDVQP